MKRDLLVILVIISFGILSLLIYLNIIAFSAAKRDGIETFVSDSFQQNGGEGLSSIVEEVHSLEALMLRNAEKLTALSEGQREILLRLSENQHQFEDNQKKMLESRQQFQALYAQIRGALTDVSGQQSGLTKRSKSQESTIVTDMESMKRASRDARMGTEELILPTRLGTMETPNRFDQVARNRQGTEELILPTRIGPMETPNRFDQVARNRQGAEELILPTRLGTMETPNRFDQAAPNRQGTEELRGPTKLGPMETPNRFDQVARSRLGGGNLGASHTADMLVMDNGLNELEKLWQEQQRYRRGA